jgi:hypothetical protein
LDEYLTSEFTCKEKRQSFNWRSLRLVSLCTWLSGQGWPSRRTSGTKSRVFIQVKRTVATLLTPWENTGSAFFWQHKELLLVTESIKIWQQRASYMKTNIHFLSHLAQFFKQNFSHKIFRSDQNKHFMFNIFFFFENRAVVTIMSKIIIEPGRPQRNIRFMRISCWILKATNAHSEYVIPTAFPQQKWLHERALTLRYTYIACPVTASLFIVDVDSWFFLPKM